MNANRKQYFGQRLKAARKMEGLSLQALSDLIGNIVSKQAINKYEEGQMVPSPKVIVEISKALKVDIDYLLKGKPLEVGPISFRKNSMVSVTQQESIEEKVKDYIERISELESLLNLNVVFTNPIEHLVITNDTDSIKAANNLRNKWGLGTYPIHNLVNILENKGIRVFLVDEIDGFDGLSGFTQDNLPFLAINTSDKPVERIRFTIIHELAHLLLNIDKSQLTEKEVEKLCHNFSSHFILPESTLFESIGAKRSYIRIAEIESIKEDYGISLRAIITRLRDSNTIVDSTYSKWMVYLSKTYGRKKEPGNYKGIEKPRQLSQLVNRALAEGIISLTKASVLIKQDVNELRRGIDV